MATPPPPLRRTGAATLVGVAVVFLGLVCLQDVRPDVRPLPVSLPVLFLAIALARLGLVADRARGHYVWIAIGCVAFALLAPLGAPLSVRDVALDLLIGGGLIVAAVGDDRVLRSFMAERSE